MPRPIDRRTFLSAVPAVLAAPTLLGCAAKATAKSNAAAPASPAASGPRIALIGCGGRGADNLGDLLGAGANIVALCDVSAPTLESAAKRAPGAATYADLRQVFRDRRTLGLDGVLVSTPDHTHAFPTALALRAGLPVYCEKPLTHTMEESRRLLALSRAARVPTQLGTQIHATENYRRVVELIRGGAIGRVTSCDCWVNKGWCCGPTGPVAAPPAGLDYDLWLGPAQNAPYIENLHPANWRKYWAYGTGTLGDMGCHMLDLPVWALGLERSALSAVEIHADCERVDSVACPEWTEASWAFPQKDADPLILRWFDNGRVSPTAQELGAKDRVDYHGRFNMVFQGTKGFLWANYGEHLVTPGAVAAEVVPPASRLAPSPGHHREWLDAIAAWRRGEAGAADAPLCAFSRATVLNEIVLSGTVAARARRAVRYDFATQDFEGGDPIAGWHPAARPGWSLSDGDLDRVLAS
jgi:predicted dehydrogenase